VAFQSRNVERDTGQRVGKQAAAIRAELVGSDTCSCPAFGITIDNSSPVIALARKLIAAGVDPAMSLHAFRGGTLALVIAHIGAAAAIEPRGDGIGFRPVAKLGASPATAANDPALPAATPARRAAACAAARMRVRR
jgi:hypothetical protein